MEYKLHCCYIFLFVRLSLKQAYKPSLGHLAHSMRQTVGVIHLILYTKIFEEQKINVDYR